MKQHDKQLLPSGRGRPAEALAGDMRELIESVLESTGFDFRDYEPASLGRSIRRRVNAEGLHSARELNQLVSRDRGSLERLLAALTIPVTSMFRDPETFAALRKYAMPYLRTYPSVKCWVAGCSSGEEAYSLAILLQEEGLLGNAQIYATDLNEDVLVSARSGVLPASTLDDCTRGHAKTGSTRAFSEHYTTEAGQVRLHASLLQHISFEQHNLVSDGSFNEFHLVLCRNVLMYFGRDLQHRVQQLLHVSLIPLGYIALGRSESFRFSPLASAYRSLDYREHVYRKIV